MHTPIQCLGRFDSLAYRRSILPHAAFLWMPQEESNVAAWTEAEQNVLGGPPARCSCRSCDPQMGKEWMYAEQLRD